MKVIIPNDLDAIPADREDIVVIRLFISSEFFLTLSFF